MWLKRARKKGRRDVTTTTNSTAKELRASGDCVVVVDVILVP